MSKLQAKVLEVLSTELNGNGDESRFKVYEFSNGLILVPSHNTNDWFFEDRDSIQANGNDVVVGIEETDRTVDFTKQELKNSVKGSKSEFGEDSVPSKYLELL